MAEIKLRLHTIYCPEEKKMNYIQFHKKIYIGFLLMFNIIILTQASATPKEIILIRHADKLEQQDPGPFLSPKGVARAELFSKYYLSTYHMPDYIITTAQTHYSFRELQTVIPLVTYYAMLRPQGGQPVLLNNKYKHDKNLNGLKRLYTDLLKDDKFSGKTILICWHHAEIPELLEGLGATPYQPKLADEEYDTVYHILFDGHKGVVKLTVLANQYPVDELPII